MVIILSYYILGCFVTQQEQTEIEMVVNLCSVIQQTFAG